MKIGTKVRVVDPGGFGFLDETVGLRTGDTGHVRDIWNMRDGTTYYLCTFPTRYLPAGYALREEQVEQDGQMTLEDAIGEPIGNHH